MAEYEWEERRRKENAAMEIILPECRKCGKTNCHEPCGVAKAILANHGLQYNG